MFRNNNHKVAVEADNCDWHFILWGMPSEIRRVVQTRFADTVAEPLTRWFVESKRRGSHALIWWYPETQAILLEFR